MRILVNAFSAFLLGTLGAAVWADPMSLYGLNMEMPETQIELSLLEKGFECQKLTKEELGKDLPTDSPFVKALSCYSSAQIGEIEGLEPRVVAVEKRYPEVSKKLFTDLPSIVDDARLSAAVRETLQVGEAAANTLKVVVLLETIDRKHLIFSCAVFNSCTRSAEEIREGISRDVLFDRDDLDVSRPEILSDVYAIVKPAFLMESVKGDVLDRIFTLTNADTLNFDEAPVWCIYSGRDKACYYDGALRFRANEVAAAANFIPLTPVGLTLLFNIFVPVKGFWMERGMKDEGVMSFK